MSTHDLPHTSPSAEGVDAAGIEAFLDAIDEAPEIELHSLVVLRHGNVISEGWWSPYSADRVHLLYSLSKSFTSTAAAFAVAEGLLDLDATVLSYFPELDAEISDPRSRAMKVRHVAAMASGHSAETMQQAWSIDPTDLVRAFLLIPPDHEPGTVFAYNQPCTYSLAAIVQRQSGQTLVDYLRPRLFDPLGIGDVGWLELPEGRNLGFSGLHVTTDAIARLGQLYLQQGRWGDRQLLDPAWVAEATSKQVDNPNEANPDWHQGYGFQFWMARHGYRGDGAYGQFCVVLPEQDMVIAITSATENMQGVLDAVWAHLLPAVDAREPDVAADRRVADRLADAALPVRAAQPEPAEAGRWDGATFSGAPTPDAQGAFLNPNGPVVAEAALRKTADGWQVSLTDAGGRLDLAVGTDGWETTESQGVPVAVSGGWVDADTFVADAIFVETPHTLRLTCSALDRTVLGVWATKPGHPQSLAELRKP
jgi:CubicO group peptidase (beta-lactamase class C family)